VHTAEERASELSQQIAPKLMSKEKTEKEKNPNSVSKGKRCNTHVI
jgi:hypothetical protein